MPSTRLVLSAARDLLVRVPLAGMSPRRYGKIHRPLTARALCTRLGVAKEGPSATLAHALSSCAPCARVIQGDACTSHPGPLARVSSRAQRRICSLDAPIARTSPYSDPMRPSGGSSCRRGHCGRQGGAEQRKHAALAGAPPSRLTHAAGIRRRVVRCGNCPAVLRSPDGTHAAPPPRAAVIDYMFAWSRGRA